MEVASTNSEQISLKRTLSDSLDEIDTIKKIKTEKINTIQTNILKNSIQQLYEIKQIQPIDFEMLSSEGPQHKTIFKFCLKFKANEIQLKFYGDGLNKKAAKTIAAMKALLFLAESLNSFDKEYFKSLIIFDMKSLNITESYETYVEILKRDIQPNESRIDSLKSEPLESIPDTIHDSDMLLDSTPIEPKIKLNVYDNKTREIIATKMPMNIFNHMLSSTQHYSFTLLSETGMSHSKLFKMELKIDKTVFNEYSVSTIVDISSLKTNDSLLFTEDHKEYSFIGFGPSLKIAKSRAAQLALEFLFNIKITSPELEFVSNDNELVESDSKIKEFADNISELAKNKFNSLLNVIEAKANKTNSLLSNLSTIFDEEIASSKKLRNVYAAIIQSNGFDYNSSKLICVTTGTKCINGEFMSQMGTSINDCHAEILAVRLLRKYLYKQLNEFIAQLKTNLERTSEPTEQPNEDKSIFEVVNCENDSSILKKPFRLKSNIKFHLYISSAPCGDGRIFSIHDNIPADNHPNRKVRGLLRTKLESGEGTVPVSNVIEIQTWDGILIGERLKVMSCSDKLCKYNVVGVQGALLSHFIETVYLSSLIIGGYYHKYHLSRALYGRVCENLTDLPPGFKLNLPILSSITNNEQRKVAKSSNRSVIWSNELNKLNENFEIINCREGRSIDGSPSLICKLELFKDWLSVLKTLKNSSDLEKAIKSKNYLDLNDNGSLITYNEVKLLSKDYQTAKLKVYEAFRKGKLGSWVTKPFEQNYFSLNELQ